MLKINISFSEYRVFRNCPFKHFLQRNLGYQEPTNEFLQFGSALHSSIEDIIQQKLIKVLYKNVFIEKLKAEGVSEQYLKTIMGKNLINEGVSILEKLDFFKRFEGWEIVGVELEINQVFFEYKGYEIGFKGVIDLILKKDDKFLILDWKSALEPWDIEKKKQDLGFFGQLAFYKTFYSQLNNIPLKNIETRFVALSRKPITVQQFNINITEDFRQEILNDFKLAIQEMIDINPLNIPKAKFINPSFCTYCKLNKKICNDQKKQLVPFELDSEKI
jgi:ATP-dependent exoDNAse (exonuclease V) beta subunit